MTGWNVHIEPGAIRRLGERSFLAELHAAVTSLIEDRERKIILLKSIYFDIGIPRRWKDLVAELRARPQ
jgi:hypothetical protein